MLYCAIDNVKLLKRKIFVYNQVSVAKMRVKGKWVKDG